MAAERGSKENRAIDHAVTRTGWRTLVPLFALILALFALVLLPVLRARLVQPLHEDLRSEIEPARSLVTRIHLALAMEGTLARDFMERRDTLLIPAYRQALTDELAATQALETHIDRLGPNVRTEFNALKVGQNSWHAAIAESFDAPSTRSPLAGRSRLDPFHAREFERLLFGAARLDEALSNAAEKRWAEAAATNRGQRWLTVVVGLIALGATMIVAWLGRGLRLYAAAAERDRAQLEEAIEDRARLVRGITHDLKNPLGAIVGYADLLSQGVKGPLTSDQSQSVERIRKSAESMLSLIGDILDMSRAERGHLGILMRNARIESIVEDAVKEQAASAAVSGHRIDVEVPGRLPVVETDPLRVRQVLGNLLSNAIKYSPAGAPISVRSSLRSRDGENEPRWVSVQVVDRGPGIPDEQSQVIFEEFSRLRIHRDMPGAGLGLSISRRISRLLGGDLTVERGAEQGSVFTLWLPTSRSESVPAAAIERAI